MAFHDDPPIRDHASLARFEAAMTLEQRLPERSVLDVFIGAAARQPERIAITMLMSGAADEQPRRINYAQLLGMVRRAANLFASVGGPRPGVAYMLPALVETHATLWGAETAGYAVPINFLLQVEHIAALLEASGARILVALGPHPVLDIWQKALALHERMPGLTLIRVAPPGTPVEEGVIDFHAALAASRRSSWSSASRAKTTPWRPTFTPGAPPAHPGWWPTRTAGSWSPRSVARRWAASVQTTC